MSFADESSRLTNRGTATPSHSRKRSVRSEPHGLNVKRMEARLVPLLRRARGVEEEPPARAHRPDRLADEETAAFCALAHTRRVLVACDAMTLGNHHATERQAGRVPSSTPTSPVATSAAKPFGAKARQPRPRVRCARVARRASDTTMLRLARPPHGRPRAESPELEIFQRIGQRIDLVHEREGSWHVRAGSFVLHVVDEHRVDGQCSEARRQLAGQPAPAFDRSALVGRRDRVRDANFGAKGRAFGAYALVRVVVVIMRTPRPCLGSRSRRA